MMVFMVKGLFTHFRFPYLQLPCFTIMGDLIFEPFWEAIFGLERIGFKVLATTFDGASVN
uniref:Transposable element P transposase-like RNase H domain-containing protein n=1 Tax=Amphimedon queenslandica TaxID=400682 RepID=A0A1X7TQE3_AMPQE